MLLEKVQAGISFKQIINYALVWRIFKVLMLTKNMRLKGHGTTQSSIETKVLLIEFWNLEMVKWK